MFLSVPKETHHKNMEICVNAYLEKLIMCMKEKVHKRVNVFIFARFFKDYYIHLQLILHYTYNIVSIASNASAAPLSAVFPSSSFAQSLTWKHTNDEDDENDVRA